MRKRLSSFSFLEQQQSDSQTSNRFGNFFFRLHFNCICNRKNALDDDEQNNFRGGFFFLSPKGFKEEMSFSSPPNALGANWKRKRKRKTTNLSDEFKEFIIDGGVLLFSLFSFFFVSINVRDDDKDDDEDDDDAQQQKNGGSDESWRRRHVLSSSLGPSGGVSPVLAPVDIRPKILAILLRGVSGGDNYVATALTYRENCSHVTSWEFDSVFCRVFRRGEEPKLEQVLSL